MSLNRVNTNGPGHLSLNEATSGLVGSDGRFQVHLHDSAQALARQIQQSVNKPQKDTRADPLQKANFLEGLRLNIAIHIVGSRGDVQPFIPIAQLLSSEPFNHRVRICTHPVFKDFVEGQGVEFFSIGGDPEALMAYMVKNPGLLPNKESIKAGDVAKRREEMWEIINGAWRSCIEAGNGMGDPIKAANVRDAKDLFIADMIIANPPSMAHIHCAEKLGIPLQMVFTMPWSPTEAFAHPLAAMKTTGADAKTANYLSFVLMELLTWQGLGDLINKFRHQKLHLEYISPMWGYQLLPRLQVPFTYLWSESLIPKPSDWGSHINITGFSFLPLASSYTPPPDLVAFLDAGPPPVYIGFGSIVVDDPEGLTAMLFQAVRAAGVRAIISKGWSDVGGNDDVPKNIYIVGNCPHDWLFQRVSAVIHHGGAGTTAAGIAAGRPTVVVPFFGDQPFWGEMIARAGAGPEPVPFKKMTAETLSSSIAFALKPAVQEGARKMAEKVAKEEGAKEMVKLFQERCLSEGLRQCDLCPGRLANWVHKKTGRNLSGFAAACLIRRHVIQPTELKLLCHKNWYVDEGAEHPLIGIAASFTGFAVSVATATSDYIQAIKHRPGARARTDTATSGIDLSVLEIGRTEKYTPNSSSQEETHNGTSKNSPFDDFTPIDLEIYSKSLAKKSFRSFDSDEWLTHRQPTAHEKRKASWKSREQGQHGNAWYITRATGRYATELTKACLKTPVAFFWNTANGFHNFPSYGFVGVEVRRRDQITGLGSGIRTAGKECILGFWEAMVGIVAEPYKAIHDEGAKGIGKGIWRAGKGFFSNLGCSIFSLPGYTLKGLEKELSKRHLTKLKAEIILIRVRQASADFRLGTEEEKDKVVAEWTSCH